jgi:hypothetical protein
MEFALNTQQQQLFSLLGRGGFLLRTFCARHPAVLKADPPDCRELEVPTELDRNYCIKTLSLLWNPSSHHFLIIKGTCIQNLGEPKNSPVSIIIIYFVAAIFAPLGIINPIVVVYKIFLQQLWLHKIDWD